MNRIQSHNRTIQEASTSIAGMVGVTERGPMGAPVLLTSVGAFERVFGGLLDHRNYPGGQDALPHAVSGFFANGGTRLYVVRVLGDVPANSRSVFQDDTSTAVLQVCASTPGTWGNRISATLTRRQRRVGALAERAASGTDQVRLRPSAGVSLGAVLVIGGKSYSVVHTKPDNVILLGSGLDGAVSEADPVFCQEFDLLIELKRNGAAIERERFTHLNLNPDSARYAPAVLGSCGSDGTSPSRDGASGLVRLHVTDAVAARSTCQPVEGTIDLANGNDGTLSASRVIGVDSDDPDQRTGIHSLKNEEQISLVAAPGWTDIEVQKALLRHCEQQVYRFAVLDSEPGVDVMGARAHRNHFDSSRGAMYYPWLSTTDPFDPTGKQHRIPPAGHVLGIYARVDNRGGVWKAPANEVIRDVLGFENMVSQEDQALLNPVHVNCLRDFRSEQRGLRVWGARTLSSDPNWRYVSVRRTALFVEQSVDVGLQWVSFEPNVRPLWDTVRHSVTGFLRGVWRKGGLAGGTQEQAFVVNVGLGRTMNQTDLDNGRLIVEIGIAPVRPAEFVIIRIIHKTAEAVG